MARRLNPCELEIDLFCKGIRISEKCSIQDDGRLFSRTRAGLGSGLELIVPGDLKEIWMNVPVEEDFAQDSPYVLTKEAGIYYVVDERRCITYPVNIPTEPSWYRHKTSKGMEMSKIGVLQGTYLGIYISNSCGFWYHSPSLGCKFCTTGLNVGVNELAQKDIEDVVETALAAKQESGATFVHLNTGYHSGKDLDKLAPFVKALKEQVGIMVGVQCIPSKELWKYDWMADLGADHFSFCYEFHNPEYFAKLLPGKEKFVSQETFFRAMEYTAKKLGKGAVSGEIIAGVEPIEDTLKAIDYITGVGAFPTVCIFRPTIGAEMERVPPPKYEDMVVVMRHMYEACRRNLIPIGLAPNIEVSLIVNPDDAKFLVPRDWRFYAFETLMKAARPFAKIKFHRELQARPVKASDTDNSPYRPVVKPVPQVVSAPPTAA